MAKPNLLVVKLPGRAGTRGPAGSDGISAVNNIINPIVTSDVVFNNKTEVSALSYTMSPSVTLTFETTLILKGLQDSMNVIYVEGPDDSIVSSVMTYPYAVAPAPSGNVTSFGLQANSDDDYYVVKINGSVRNGNSIGKIAIYVENIDGFSGGYVASGSYAQWSVPVFDVIKSGNSTGPTNGLTKEQADGLYASKTDSRLTDARRPLDKTVNSNSIAAGGLPISSIDQLRNELDSRIKTVNGTSPDSNGNVNVSGGGVSGITQNDADVRYVRLNDARLTDQRIPLDNSVINIKVPNAALEVSKINGLQAAMDTLIAQIANVTQRLTNIEQNGAPPGGNQPGTGYPAVYTVNY